MKAVFLDRDGTIGGDGGGVHPFEFTLYDFSSKAIRYLNKNGIKVFLFTNQSWIGMGKFTEEAFLAGCKRMMKELQQNGAYLDDIYYCPHKPEDQCDSRKPKTTLLMKAKEKYKLDLEDCYIVGDRFSDIQAAKKVGAKKILVKTGRGQKTLADIKPPIFMQIDYVTENLLSAVEWILEDIKLRG